MATHIDNKKSIMMDKVEKELKEMIESIVVKLDFIANREETVQTRSLGDQYVAAVKMQDSFNTYSEFSEYAVFKAGLSEECVRDKYLIPREKRGEVVLYQRDFVIKSYVEKNNYYRTMAGLPDLDDDEYIYVTELSNITELEGVDLSKPVHEMEVEEINIIDVMGILDKLIELHPDKKYLKFLDSETRIPIYESRQAQNYSILYIYRDKSKQPISEMFVAIYNRTRDYVLDRFYDKAYAFKSPYYDGYIGLFILTITVQRFITNYFKKFINRDFYDKDIIKLLFQSYGLPFYNDIPLSYLQKIAKNLNRLLIYKATDRVFTDIFKIFDMDNVEICNYVLFKNPKMDNKNRPVLIYKERTELGYQVDTVSTLLKSTNDFYGTIKLDYFNINQIEELQYNNEFCRVILMNNGIVVFDVDKENSFYNAIMSRNCDINDDHQLQFNEYFNFHSIKKVTLNDGSTAIYLICKKDSKMYKLSHNSFEEIDLKSALGISKAINNFMIKQDETTLKKILCVNYLTNSEVYEIDNNSFIKIGSLNETISNGDYYDNAIVLSMSSGKLFIYGDNKNNRLLHRDAIYFNDFIEINDVMGKTIDAKLFDKGCVFIMANGTVRYTREIPIIDNITDIHDTDMLSYISIKNIFNLDLDGKRVYCLTTYDGTIEILNYSYDETYGELLYYADVPNPSCAFKYIKNICQTNNGVIITQFGTESTIGYSGENENSNFPFISTLSMVHESNDLNIQYLQIYKGFLFFTTTLNEFYVFRGHELENLTKFVPNEQIQKLVVVENELYILVGKPYMYVITGSTTEDMNINKIIMDKNKIIVDVIKDGENYSDLIIKTNENKLYKLNIDKFEQIQSYDCFNEVDNTTVLVRNIDNEYFMDLSIQNKTYDNIKLLNLNSLTRVTICDNIILFESDVISFIKISEIDETVTEITVTVHDELTNRRAKSVRINNNLIIYNKSGGISILRNFLHADRLDTQINEDFVSLFDDSVVTELTFDENNIIKLEESNKYVTYEEDVKNMYDLSFVEIPLGSKETVKYLNDTAYHMDYDLVIHDDRLWMGDRDENEYLSHVLSAEFNYVSSKYISINSTYDLMKLNFEVCYMFKMLTELKDAEKYLNCNVRFAGETPIFEVVVALFALTCKKFGLEGNILNTKTQALSVLGFNFSVDSKYIAQIVKDAKLYKRDPNFKQSDIEIIKNPTLFKDASQLLNLYLDNEVVLQNIYTYMYNAKTIQEYNAYKKLEQAELFSFYYEDRYKVGDEYATTYLDYLKRVNPVLYQMVDETTDETMLEVMDYFLLALTDFLDSDKFEFLFLNIPSLSLDLIKKFIYYLVDIFKSYTVELKTMNVIYHIDDKRLSNLKLVFQENFKAKFDYIDRYKLIDLFDYVLTGLTEYEKLKMYYLDNISSTWDEHARDIIFRFIYTVSDVIDQKFLSLIEDFSDFFTTMDGFWSVNGGKGETYEIVKGVFYEKTIGKIEELLYDDKINITITTVEQHDKYLFNQIWDLLSAVNYNESFVNYIQDIIHYSGKFTGKTVIDYKDKIGPLNHFRHFEEEIVGDFSDTISSSSSMVKKNSINYKEIPYFIRTGE